MRCSPRAGMTTCSPLGSSYHPPNRNPIQTGLPSAVSGSTMTGAQVFASELALIERVVHWVCARRSLRGADAEDFASTVKLRLIENDYEILARFEGAELPQDLRDGGDQPPLHRLPEPALRKVAAVGAGPEAGTSGAAPRVSPLPGRAHVRRGARRSPERHAECRRARKRSTT